MNETNYTEEIEYDDFLQINVVYKEKPVLINLNGKEVFCNNRMSPEDIRNAIGTRRKTKKLLLNRGSK